MISHTVHNITVPYVDLDHFDWSFTRTGPLPWNQTVWSLLAVFTALPIWMTIELTVWIFYTFKKYTGLYFYSTLICDWGTTIHAIGFVLKWCVPECNWIISTVLAEIGWVSMVSGFSVVLYSRLHLVRQYLPQSTLRWVLIMICIDACLFHIPTIVFQFLTSNASTHKKFVSYMAPMERVQVMGFSTQETIISALYVYATIQMLQQSMQMNKHVRKTVIWLIVIQIAVVLADVIVIALDYCEFFTLKAVLHSLVYAIKLQLEFVILNKFREVVGGGKTNTNPNHAHGHRDLGFSPSINLTSRSPSPPSSGETLTPSVPTSKLARGKKAWWSSLSILPSHINNNNTSSNSTLRSNVNPLGLTTPTSMIEKTRHISPFIIHPMPEPDLSISRYDGSAHPGQEFSTPALAAATAAAQAQVRKCVAPPRRSGRLSRSDERFDDVDVVLVDTDENEDEVCDEGDDRERGREGNVNVNVKSSPVRGLRRTDASEDMGIERQYLGAWR